MRGCQLGNIACWLSARELGRTSLRRPFSEVPERLQIPVDSIIDEHEHLRGAVILGWTHSGNTLISYTNGSVPAADGKPGHHLQLWRFDPFRRAVQLCNIRLFYEISSLRQQQILAGELRFDITGATYWALLVTVWVAPDDSLIVVHGEAAEDAVPLDICHVTVIPAGALLGDEQANQAIHFDYRPLQQLVAFQLALPGTLVLATAGGIACVQVAAGPAKLKPTKAGTARMYPPLPAALTSGHESPDFEVLFGSSMWLKAGEVGRCNTVFREDVFEINSFLHKWMLSYLPGHKLLDFDLQFVALLPPTAPGTSCATPPAETAASSEYDFVESDEDDDNRDTGNCRVLGSSIVLVAAAARKVSAAGLHPAVAAIRTVCLLVDIDLATGVGEVLSAAEAAPQQQAEPDVQAAAAAHAEGWCRRFTLPQDARHSPTVLSNASVLETGQSVEHLRHPWLPMCLTGYGVAA